MTAVLNGGVGLAVVGRPTVGQDDGEVALALVRDRRNVVAAGSGCCVAAATRPHRATAPVLLGLVQGLGQHGRCIRGEAVVVVVVGTVVVGDRADDSGAIGIDVVDLVRDAAAAVARVAAAARALVEHHETDVHVVDRGDQVDYRVAHRRDATLGRCGCGAVPVHPVRRIEVIGAACRPVDPVCRQRGPFGTGVAVLGVFGSGRAAIGTVDVIVGLAFDRVGYAVGTEVRPGVRHRIPLRGLAGPASGDGRRHRRYGGLVQLVAVVVGPAARTRGREPVGRTAGGHGVALLAEEDAARHAIA